MNRIKKLAARERLLAPTNDLVAPVAAPSLSQEERTEFHHDAVRRAHAARADAVRALFRVFKRRFHRQPLMTRAAMSSAAVFAVALSLGVVILSLRFA